MLMIFQGDVNSKESLEKALAGAYAVFAVTNYWEKMDPDLEIKQGKLIADVSVVSSQSPRRIAF